MAKAIMIGVTYHTADPNNLTQVLVLVTFRFVGLSQDLGTLDAMVTLTQTDTQATVTTKIQNAIVTRAAEYGITLTIDDVIPVVRGVPQTLMSAASSATLILTDDGSALALYGSLPSLRISADLTSGAKLDLSAAINQLFLEFRPSSGGFLWYESDRFGGADLTFVGVPSGSIGYTIIDSTSVLGMILNTTTNSPISFRPNSTEVAYVDSGGLNMAAGAKLNNIAAPSGGKSVTNNVTIGGTADQGDDFTSLTIYATDAAAIRNNIYQLWQKVDRIADGLRTVGILADS